MRVPSAQPPSPPFDTVKWRHLLARLALGTALATVLWTAALLIHGGFETWVLGVRIKSTNPLRPLLIAFAAILAFLASVGEDKTDRAMFSVLDFSRRLFAHLNHRLLAITLASGVRPRVFANCSEATTTAAAPSLIIDEFPAVTVPSSVKTGRRRDSLVRVVSTRGPSSRVTT